MVKAIRAIYPVTVKRAGFIARDQSNKLNAATVRARQLDLGLTQGKWMHSHAGHKPRPSHLAADGKTFELAKGMFLDGEWVLPGEKPNCRCSWRIVIPMP